MTPGDRVIVTEPACVEEICDAFGIDSNAYRIYPGGWFSKEEITPVEPEKIDLWRVEAGPAKYTCETEAEARGLARFFKTAKVRRLIAFVVKEPRP